ncbi:potassium channel family protein [Paracoccus benzoatiresistens]|uniref:Potassium channel family protein n=1 Tax=Paracoccus benzoatiresistens TaxID=2997341 RepID=A0ABT4J8Q8_9RHOB|nr:potassium channel family protein [Paracoccus sp. EF6]MCZ0963478.1 potassium channel family protein [Paracoccus sp. EF6]
MRFLSAYVRLVRAIYMAFRSTQVQALILVCILIALAQAVIFMRIEGWRFLDAFYFSVVSMATVGYGDLAPRTPLGKITALVFLMVGVGIFVLTVSSIAQVILGEISPSAGHPAREKEPDHAGPE